MPTSQVCAWALNMKSNRFLLLFKCSMVYLCGLQFSLADGEQHFSKVMFFLHFGYDFIFLPAVYLCFLITQFLCVRT